MQCTAVLYSRKTMVYYYKQIKEIWFFFCTKNLKIYFTFTRKSCAQKVLLTNFNRQFQLKETVRVISSDSLCSRSCQCQIHNGTLKSFVWSIMNEVLMFISLKTNYFLFWFLYKRTDVLLVKEKRKTYISIIKHFQT